MGQLRTVSVLLAYIDLGTGSYLLQLAIAAFLGTLLAVKAWWPKLKSFMKKMLLRSHRTP